MPEISSNCNPIIPNIFNFKDKCLEDGENNEILLFPRLFLKIRAIQLLEMNNGRMHIVPLVKRLKKCYSAPCETIRADIREMIFSGILYPQIKITELLEIEDVGITDETHRDYPLKLMALGKIILKQILYKAIYYEIVCDDTPIDDSFITSKWRPVHRYDNNLSLEDYLIRKSYSLLMFINYLRRVESFDLQRWEEMGQKLPMVMTGPLIDAVKKDVEKYIYKRVNNLTNPSFFCKNWCNFFDFKIANLDFLIRGIDS